MCLILDFIIIPSTERKDIRKKVDQNFENRLSVCLSVAGQRSRFYSYDQNFIKHGFGGFLRVDVDMTVGECSGIGVKGQKSIFSKKVQEVMKHGFRRVLE